MDTLESVATVATGDTPGLWGKLGNIQTIFTAPQILNEEAEWNVYISAKDLDTFLQFSKTSDIEVYLVPLNASTQVKIKPDYLDTILKNRKLQGLKKPDAKVWMNNLVETVLMRYETQIEQGYLEFWDALSAHLFIRHVILSHEASNVSQQGLVVVNADRNDYPFDFYRLYEQKNLKNHYHLDKKNFITNLKQHHEWAKSELNKPNAKDTYGVMQAWFELERIPKTYQNKVAPVTIFTQADEALFAKHFLDSVIPRTTENIARS